MKVHGRRNQTQVSRGTVREVFGHLVLNDRVLDQLGPGIAARQSLFVYGPPGNGKSVIAHAIVNLLGGDIAIPHAISVDTEIIRLFDPLIHQEVDAPTEDPGGLVARMPVEDGRW